MPSLSLTVVCSSLPDCVAPVFVQVVSPTLGWSRFFVIWSPSGDTRCSSVAFEALDMPCQGPFHFLTLLNRSLTFVLSLTHMLDFLPLYVMLSIFLSMFCNIKIGGSTRELYICLFKLMAVLLLKISRYLACHDYSLYIFVLFIFLQDVVFPR